jgi:hypothetical protein
MHLILAPPDGPANSDNPPEPMSYEEQKAVYRYLERLGDEEESHDRGGSTLRQSPSNFDQRTPIKKASTEPLSSDEIVRRVAKVACERICQRHTRQACWVFWKAKWTTSTRRPAGPSGIKPMQALTGAWTTANRLKNGGAKNSDDSSWSTMCCRRLAVIPTRESAGTLSVGKKATDYVSSSHGGPGLVHTDSHGQFADSREKELPFQLISRDHLTSNQLCSTYI